MVPCRMTRHEDTPAGAAASAFAELYEVVARLRAPDGCPWDREQDSLSIRGNLIEETYECVEAIDSGDTARIREELGDVFLVAMMLAFFQEEAGTFAVGDAPRTASEKLIRRHPHVFADVKVSDSREVLDNWRRIKVEQEGRAPKDSALDEVSGALHPLDRAWKLQKKAAKLGFDWPDAEGVAAKVREELTEAMEAAQGGDRGNTEEELGDLLFAAVNLCRFLGVEPTLALRRANGKFEARFRQVEKGMREAGLPMEAGTRDEMNRFWDEAKGGNTRQSDSGVSIG